jgi:hypothetical protein
MEEAVRSIRVSEIRKMMNAALDALEAEGVEEIRLNLDKDEYWSIYHEDAFDFTKPPEPVVGTLQDDIRDLRRDIESLVNAEGTSAWHMFHHLRGIVLMLAERSGPS